MAEAVEEQKPEIQKPEMPEIAQTVQTATPEGIAKKSYNKRRVKANSRWKDDEDLQVLEFLENGKNYTPTGKFKGGALDRLSRKLGRTKAAIQFHIQANKDLSRAKRLYGTGTDKETAPVKRLEKGEIFKACDNCGKLAPERKYCPHCGKWVE